MATPRQPRRQLHAVFMPTMQSGHINPMLELAQRLIDSFGIEASFIVTEEWVSKVEPKAHKNIKLVKFYGEIDQLADNPPLEPLEQLVTSLETPVPASCLISDAFLGWSQELANRLSIPRVALWTCTAIVEVMCSNIPILVSKGYIPVNAAEDHTSLITFIREIPPILPTELPLAFYSESPFVPRLGEALQQLKQAHSVLLNTVEELEQRVVDLRRETFKYFPVGPLIPMAVITSELSANDPALQWLDNQAPSSVLYIAFGSHVSLPFVQVENIAQGLELSKQPFLWAMRKNFATDAPEGFIQTLQDKFPAGQGLIVEWSQQAQVLAHTSVGGFFTHCGWNSVMEAVCSGVPMLCWACAAEQNINASTIVNDWKVGFKVAEGLDGTVAKEDLAQLVSRLMIDEEGKEMRNKIQGLQELVKGVFKEGGSSYRNLSLFVDGLY